MKKSPLDHSNTGTNKTYTNIPVHKTNNQAISDHTRFLKNKFNLEVDGENKNFLTFTELLNFINTHSKTKFIITASQFSVKTFFRAVTSVLRLIYKQKEIYNLKMRYLSRVKRLSV